MRPPMCLQMVNAVLMAGMKAVSIAEFTGVEKYMGSVSSS